MTLSRQQKLIIILLLFYWPAIFILTHIPIPQVVYKAHVSDKTIHFLAYFILIFLLWFAINPGRKVNWRKAAAWCILFVVVWYGVADEVLQGYVGRSCDVRDFIADLTGTLAGLILFSLLTFWPASLVVTGTTIFLLENLAKANLSDLVPIINTLFHLFAYSFFAILWGHYIHLYLAIKPPKYAWLALALAVPITFLFLVKLFSVISGSYFDTYNVIIAAAGIVIVVLAYYIIVLLRCSIAKKNNLPGN